MPHWKVEQLQQLLSETVEQRMFDKVAGLAQQLGMEYFSFALRTYAATQRPQLKVYNTYPTAWNEHYQRYNYASIDPIFALCHRSLMPVLWHDEIFRETPDFWEHAKNHGLRHGWSQSAHDARHNESILSVVRSHTPVDTAEFYNAAGQTLWLCNQMHTLILERALAKPPQAFSLTARESEVLKWSAAGKTAAEVACILSLSQSTVNFHIRSFISKMNSSNKAGAIAIAAMNGLLE
ncbi:MAG: autoinducer binding domain-containing protein [Pseudomonas sp.]